MCFTTATMTLANIISMTHKKKPSNLIDQIVSNHKSCSLKKSKIIRNNIKRCVYLIYKGESTCKIIKLDNYLTKNVIESHIIMKWYSTPLVIRVMWFKALIIYDQVPTEVAKMPRIDENVKQMKLITDKERVNSIHVPISMRKYIQMAVPLYNINPCRKSIN